MVALASALASLTLAVASWAALSCEEKRTFLCGPSSLAVSGSASASAPVPVVMEVMEVIVIEVDCEGSDGEW